MSANIGSVATLVGNPQNMIIVESTRGQVEIGFWDYARLGIPVSILTIVVGTIILLLLG